jgi:hypothetical protein
MHLIHAHRRVAVPTVAVLFALGVLALFAACDPSSSNETKSAKPTSDAGVKEPEADESTESNPAALHAEGWDCVYVVHAVHCLAPGVLPTVSSATAEEFTVLVFDTMDPESRDAPFLGEEVNVRADLFEGQPCPDDPPSRQYTYLPDIGVPFEYYGCHKFDSPL